MRSLGRIFKVLRRVRGQGGNIALTLASALAVGAGVAAMNDLLQRWESVEQSRATVSTAVGTPALKKPETVRVLASVAKVKDAFSSAGYDLDAVRRGTVDVPRVRLASLPYDLAKMRQAQERKAVFLRYMLPFVLETNDRVRTQRQRMKQLREKVRQGHRLGEVETMWLDALYEEYRVKRGDFAALSARVDTVPVSLALAQAAVESGWGTSRFAQEGNAAFGQWTTNDHKGMVPKDRQSGMKHKVRAFDSLKKSVESYVRNLNTHRAYRDFRKKRAAMRRNERPLDSMGLAATLLSYSEKGMAYVELLHHVITRNDLRALDGARLGDAVLEFRPDA